MFSGLIQPTDRPSGCSCSTIRLHNYYHFILTLVSSWLIPTSALPLPLALAVGNKKRKKRKTTAAPLYWWCGGVVAAARTTISTTRHAALFRVTWFIANAATRDDSRLVLAQLFLSVPSFSFNWIFFFCFFVLVSSSRVEIWLFGCDY